MEWTAWGWNLKDDLVSVVVCLEVLNFVAGQEA